MKTRNKQRKSIVMVLAAILLFAVQVNAATYTSVLNGNWSSPSTWGSATVPGIYDDVVIGSTVTLNGNYNCRTVTVNGSKELKISGTNILTTSSITNNGTLTFVASGTLVISNSAYATLFTNNGTFNAGTGIVKFTSSVTTEHTISGSATFYAVVSDNVGLKFSSNHTISNKVTLNAGGWLSATPSYGSNATLEINRSIPTVGGSDAWHMTNCWPSGSGSNVAPNISITSGTVSTDWVSGRVIKKSLSVAAGANLNASKMCISLANGSTITNSGTLTLGGIAVPSGTTWDINNNFTISDLDIQAGGTVNLNSYTLTITKSTGSSCLTEALRVVSGGKFNTGTGKVNFVLPYWTKVKVSGNIVLNNMAIEGNTLELDDPSNITVNGRLELNAGSDMTSSGSATLNYGSSATLVINTPLNQPAWRDIPWGDGTGPTVPPNVEVKSTLTLNEPKVVKGTMTVDSGSTVNNANNVNFENNTTLNSCGGTVAGSPTYGSNVTINNCGSSMGNEANGAASLVISTHTTLTKDIVLGSNSKLTVLNGITLTMGDYSITATVDSISGYIKTSNANGIDGTSGAFRNATLVLASGSTIEYNRASGTQKISPRTDYTNVVISGNATKTFVAGTYEVSGNYTVTGTEPSYDANTVLKFDGGTQNISASTFRNVTFVNAGNKNLLIQTNVSGVVSVTNSATLVSNGKLRLTSTASGTASIAALSGSAAVSGDVIVDRFIPASGRKWRFLSSPVTNAVFSSSWQKQIHLTGPGTGGSLGTTNSNGFDWTQTLNPSVYWYNESVAGNSNAGWTQLPNTSQTIVPGRGYRVFVRGDRVLQGNSLIDGSPTAAMDVTLSVTGPINNGPFSVALGCSNGCGADDGWNLVGNPYPSAIDWSSTSWTKPSNVGVTLYILNPTNNQWGAWSPFAGSVNGCSNQIASGQAFMVKVNGAATLNFVEPIKINAPSVGLFGKSENPNTIKIKLMDTTFVSDEAVVFYNENAIAGMDGYDAEKPAVSSGSISTYTTEGQRMLVFNGIPQTKPQTVDSVFLYTLPPVANKSYTLQFEGLSALPANIDVQILDRYLQTVSSVSSTNSYTYAVNTADPASYNNNRFVLLLSNTAPLPVKFEKITAKKVIGQGVVVDWSTAMEVNNDYFQVERSNNGADFSAIGQVNGKGNSQVRTTYSFLDVKPVNQVAYYRLKQVDKDGKFAYSPVVSVRSNDAVAKEEKLSAVVFPMPVQATASVKLNKAVQSVQIEVVDMQGKTVLKNTSNEHTDVFHIETVTLEPGVYIVRVISPEGTTTQKIVKE